MESEITAVSVDDEKDNLLVIERMAPGAGLAVVSFAFPGEAIGYIETNTVDLVFVDSRMPQLDGIDFIRKIRTRHADIPIVMVTEPADPEERKLKALEAGATEFLRRPFDLAEFTARVKSLSQFKKSRLFFKDWARLLQKEVEKATEKTLERESETIHIFARAAELGDPRAAGHIVRMAHFSRIIAKASGEKDFQQDLIFKSAPLHDVGMRGIPEHILLTQGALTPEEREIVKTHTAIGFQIIRDSSSPFLQTGSTIALTHHERFEGGGYPKGIRGEEIPLFGRICAIADVFDALISARPYKEPWPVERAFEYIDSQKGMQFDPRLAELFLAGRQAVQEVSETYRDST